MKRKRLKFAGLLLSVLLVVSCFLLFFYLFWTNATSYSSMLNASQDIRIGMALEQAKPILHGATSVFECGATNLYVYGNNNNVLAITTSKQNGEQVISKVTAPDSNIVEEYMEFGGCKKIE
jgi:hypothetical protein